MMAKQLKIGDTFAWNAKWNIVRIPRNDVIYLKRDGNPKVDNACKPLTKEETLKFFRHRHINTGKLFFKVIDKSPENTIAEQCDPNGNIMRFNKLRIVFSEALTTPPAIKRNIKGLSMGIGLVAGNPNAIPATARERAELRTKLKKISL